MVSYKKNVIVSFIIITLLLLVDQYTKFLAVAYLENTSGIDIIDGIFRLQYLENTGAAFGMMAGHMEFFYIITIGIVSVLLYLLYKLPNEKRYTPLWLCGLTLVAGAVGNFIDRVRLEYVVDFLYFELIDFPIFNVADIYVCVAAIVFVLLILFYYKDEEIDKINFKPTFNKNSN